MELERSDGNSLATELPGTVKRAVVCLSGGMDSTSLLLHLLARRIKVHGLSFDYGQKHRLELERLQANLDYLSSHGFEVQHSTVDLSILGQLFHSALTTDSWDVPQGFYEQENMKETVVPNRNAIFSSIAYGYALSVATTLTESDSSEEQVAIALGVHSGDHAIYPDCRPDFYRELMSAFATGNWDAERVRLFVPYLHGDKFTILKDAEDSVSRLELDFETIFRNTSTSYHPDEEGRAGGKSGADVERILAFHRLGRPDPVGYVAPWEIVLQEALEVERTARGASQ